MAHDHNVAAGGLLHMEPQVFAPGGVQGELVVLGGMVLYEVYTTVYITPRDGLAEQLKKK